jgi:hypothetical protein
MRIYCVLYGNCKRSNMWPWPRIIVINSVRQLAFCEKRDSEIIERRCAPTPIDIIQNRLIAMVSPCACMCCLAKTNNACR